MKNQNIELTVEEKTTIASIIISGCMLTNVPPGGIESRIVEKLIRQIEEEEGTEGELDEEFAKSNKVPPHAEELKNDDRQRQSLN